MKTIHVKLPKRLLTLLERESQARGITKAVLVRDCLEKSLGRRRQSAGLSCYDLAADLAGVIKGLPRELTINPKFMEGFGRS